MTCRAEGSVSVSRRVYNMGELLFKKIVFSGGLDISRYPEIVDEFSTCRNDTCHVIIDLSDVPWIDSVFMSELLIFMRRDKNAPRRIIVIAGGNVVRMLQIAGVHKKVSIVDDYDSALRSLEMQAAQ